MPQCDGMKQSSSSRRWIQLRHDLYEQVQNHVRALLGESSQGLARYQKTYEREFSRAWKISSRQDLLTSLQTARVVWMGDFHALQQSQKAQLRILKALPQTKDIQIAVECIEARHQVYLDRYLQGKMSEREFLKAVEWKRSWGFPWEYYKPLFRWASRHKIPLWGLNLKTEERSMRSLQERDTFSANKIIDILKRSPASNRLFVIYGDLHLAQAHLPQKVQRHFKRENFVYIYQNPERIYFQLLKREIEHQVDVVKVGKNRFAIVSVPPWVKWQNYLLYLESQYDRSFDDDLDLTDHVAKYVRLIAEDLETSVPTDHFSIVSARDRGAWAQLQKSLS
jgi:uncharacterized iron-regulated protein